MNRYLPYVHTCTDTSPETVNEFLVMLVRGSLEALETAGCITLGGEEEEGGEAMPGWG
jgi:hypothetical protein